MSPCQVIEVLTRNIVDREYGAKMEEGRAGKFRHACTIAAHSPGMMAA
jgi:hypothetical protein